MIRCEGVCEDDRCNREVSPHMHCKGVMERSSERECSCHINPPCGNCVDATYACTLCGFETEEPEPFVYKPPTEPEKARWAEERKLQDARDLEWREFLCLPPGEIKELRYRVFTHSNSSQKCVGRFPIGMTSAEIRAKCNGTFGGRFEHCVDTHFTFIAHTD